MFSGHTCDLVQTLAQDEFLYIDPKSSWLTRLRRRFRINCMVSRTNPRTARVLTSTAAVSYEIARHIRTSYFTIHPFSNFRSFWEIMMVFVLWLALFMIPFYTAFLSHDETGHLSRWRHIMLFLDFICMVDIGVNFMTGIFKEETQEIHLDFNKISRHYIRGYFVVDFISSVPFDYIINSIKIYTKTSRHGFQVHEFLSTLKIFRLSSMLRYMKHMTELFGLNYINAKLFKCLSLLALFLHWMACMHYLITIFVQGSDPKGWSERAWIARAGIHYESVWRKYRKCMVRAVSNTFKVGFGVEKPETEGDMTWTMINSVSGVVIFMYTIVQVMLITRITNTTNAKYEEMTIQLEEFMHHKQIPAHLKRKLITYYKFCFHKSFFREPQILDSISGQLRQELLLHSCRRLVENVNFFNDIPANLMIRIVTCLHSEVLLANDVVTKAGTPGDSMYFIASGSVAIYTGGGKEVCHLEDGAHFGEIALIMEDALRVASVVVVETCEFYVLSRSDFRNAVAPYPHLLRRIEHTALERLDRTLQMEEQDRYRRSQDLGAGYEAVANCLTSFWFLSNPDWVTVEDIDPIPIPNSVEVTLLPDVTKIYRVSHTFASDHFRVGLL